jgi:hypothetical protein
MVNSAGFLQPAHNGWVFAVSDLMNDILPVDDCIP